jgi:predicted transcriptional regulator
MSLSKTKNIASNGGVIMARKKQYMAQFFYRDKLVFSALSRTGIARTEDLKKHCNVTDGRIKNYVRDGYMEKILYKEDKEIKEAYTLTTKGRDLAEREWNLRDHYHAQTKSPYHDLQLSEKYFSLSEQERDTWRTESQVRNEFLEKLEQLRERGEEQLANQYYNMMQDRLISMPDGVYTTETGVMTAYEVITDSYGRQEMLAKEVTVEIMNYSYETKRI